MHRDDPKFKELYPFESKYLELSSGVRIHYIDEGNTTDNQSKEILLMLHGNPSWSFYYRNLIKEFSAKYRVIAPDHIGMGLSDKPQNYAYTLSNHIANVTELLEKISLGNERVNLVVHDWGGAIGMGWATANTERVGKLVILNTGAFISTDIPFRINICRIPGFGALAIRGMNAFAAAATFMAVEKPLSANVKSGYLMPYNNWKNRVATLRFVQDIPLKPSAVSYKTLKTIDGNLKKLEKKDMLILWGGRDWCFNDSFFTEWRKRFQDAKFEYYENAGHYLLEDKNKEIISRLKVFFK